MDPFKRTRRTRIVGTAVGGVVGAALLGGIGFRSGNTGLGLCAGAVLGAAMGYGVAAGTIGSITLGAVIFAVVSCLIGPAYDDHGGSLAIPAAAFGGFVGWFLRGRADA